MSQSSPFIIFGATGLVGGHLKREASYVYGVETISIYRLATNASPGRQDSSDESERYINFERLEESLAPLAQRFKQLSNDEHSGIIACCIGTTIKKAGTQEKFHAIDVELPIKIAQWAKDSGAKRFLLISAVGANPKSKVFYNRCKGEVEEQIAAIFGSALTIFRPGLLLGTRQEHRAGENFAKALAPLFNLIVPERYSAIEARDVALAMSACIRQTPDNIRAERGSFGQQILHNQAMRQLAQISRAQASIGTL